jgi:hypothetical protein
MFQSKQGGDKILPWITTSFMGDNFVHHGEYTATLQKLQNKLDHVDKNITFMQLNPAGLAAKVVIAGQAAKIEELKAHVSLTVSADAASVAQASATEAASEAQASADAVVSRLKALETTTSKAASAAQASAAEAGSAAEITQAATPMLDALKQIQAQLATVQANQKAMQQKQDAMQNEIYVIQSSQVKQDVMLTKQSNAGCAVM